MIKGLMPNKSQDIIYETKWTEFGDELDMAYEKWRNIKECSLAQLI